MDERVVCLGCGGMVADRGAVLPEGEARCVCPPPSLIPAPAWSEPPPGPCPRCEQPLARRRYGDLDAAECPACGGLLVGRATMDRIATSPDATGTVRLALPARERAREPPARYLRCPACSNLMNRRVFGRVSGVIVDVCREHGVWFDGGELAAVLAFVEGGGLERAKQRDADERAEAERARRADQRRAELSVGMTQASALEMQGSWSRWSRRSAAAEVLLALFELWGESR